MYKPDISLLSGQRIKLTPETIFCSGRKSEIRVSLGVWNRAGGNMTDEGMRIHDAVIYENKVKSGVSNASSTTVISLNKGTM